MTNLDEAAGAVARLPITMRERDVSAHAIVTNSGIRAYAPAEAALAIQAHLEAHPELIAEWLGYSEDQRCSGWYVVSDDQGFSVGYVPASATLSSEHYKSGSEACTAFIMAQLVRGN